MGVEMTTYHTGNPIGSTDPRDLYDNSQNLDQFLNAGVDTYEDRLGRERLTVEGALKKGTAIAYGSKQAMDEDTSRPVGSWAVVVNDPDSAKNGYYIKTSSGWEKTTAQPPDAEEVADALSRAIAAQQTWALPNRRFDLSDPVRVFCSRTGQILWYNEPQTGRLRTRLASSDRLWAYPYRSFTDRFRLPTVDRSGRVIGDMPQEPEAGWTGAAPLHVSFDAGAGVLRCAWRHGESQMWRTTYQRNGFNDLWNWRTDEIAPLGDPATAEWAVVPGRVTGSDSFPPLQAFALQNGDGSTNVIYTGGNHGSNGDASGEKTARMVALQISVDGRALADGEGFTGYVDSVRMQWTNELMGYNTISLGRYILRQMFDFSVRPGDVSGYCSVRGLEPIGVRTDNSLQHFSDGYDTYHFYDGQEGARLNISDATSSTSSGPAATWPSWANVLAGPYGYHGVWSDRGYGAGDGRYLRGTAGFFRYGGSRKFYSNLVGGGGFVAEFDAGQGYDWHAGYVYAPLVEGLDSAFTFNRRRRPHLGYAFTEAGAGTARLPAYVAGAEVQDVGVDGAMGVAIAAAGYETAAKLIEV